MPLDLPSPSATCAALVMHFEAFRSKAYQDLGGSWTVGYGTHWRPDGSKVQSTDILVREVAVEWLALELARITDESLAFQLPQSIKSQLRQHHIDALCSFIYNVGTGAFAGSTLLRHLMDGNWKGAAGQFKSWSMVTVEGKKQQAMGLVRRRVTEREIFLGQAPARAWEAGWREIGLAAPKGNPFEKKEGTR